MTWVPGYSGVALLCRFKMPSHVHLRHLNQKHIKYYYYDQTNVTFAKNTHFEKSHEFWGRGSNQMSCYPYLNFKQLLFIDLFYFNVKGNKY